MPYVSHVSVSLPVISEALSADEVSNRLGVSPTRVREVHQGLNWMLTAPEGYTTIDEGIASLLALVPADESVWDELAGLAKLDLFCGLFLDSMNEGLELPPEILAAIGKRHLTLSFDIYDRGE